MNSLLGEVNSVEEFYTISTSSEYQSVGRAYTAVWLRDFNDRLRQHNGPLVDYSPLGIAEEALDLEEAVEKGDWWGIAAGVFSFVDLTKPRGRTHILDGEPNRLSGGHRAGTGISGKSEFPASWSDDKIIHHVSDIATDPLARESVIGGVTIREGIREGIDIRVVIRGGEIITAYPLNVPRNP